MCAAVLCGCTEQRPAQGKLSSGLGWEEAVASAEARWPMGSGGQGTQWTMVVR